MVVKDWSRVRGIHSSVALPWLRIGIPGEVNRKNVYGSESGIAKWFSILTGQTVVINGALLRILLLPIGLYYPWRCGIGIEQGPRRRPDCGRRERRTRWSRPTQRGRRETSLRHAASVVKPKQGAQSQGSPVMAQRQTIAVSA